MASLGFGLFAWAAAVLLFAAAFPVSGAAAQSTGERPAPAPAVADSARDKHSKLDSHLAAAARAYREHGLAAGVAEARARGVRVESGSVRVVVDASSSAARSTIAAVGGRIEADSNGLARVLIPLSALERLAADPSVRYVRRPLKPAPAAVAGQGPGASLANAWQSAGWIGAGVKVAVVDLGFAGYGARQASGDLPASLTTVDFCGGTFPTTEPHGTGVAEIVHEMAPAAQLYLICIQDEVSLAQARDYAIAQGIKVINHSVVWFNSSRGDGTGGVGSPDAIVASARANGILWVNAAGNHAQKHWTGNFLLSDPNGYHNFSGSDESQTVFIASGQLACFFLKWDDWPVSAQDYDLYLLRSSDSAFVGQSVNAQTGGQPPVEDLCYTNIGASENFGLYIHRFSATTAPRFDLFSNLNLEYQVVGGSVLEPGTSPSAMMAGAVCWQNNVLESYSSQGPTVDGRTKPDIAGQDAVSSATYGSFIGCPSGFAGTSAAAPHVAGAAALVLQANPGFGPAETQAFLQGRAVDLGSAGMDSQYGSGALNMGSAPTSSTATATGTPTTNATTTNTRTPTITLTPPPSATPGGMAQMVSPAPGSTFSSSTVTFNWTSGTGVSQYWLWVGTQQGDGNLYSQSQGTSLSATVSGLPTTTPVYVRLWSRVGADWQYIDYPYGPGVVTSTPAVSPTSPGTPTPSLTPTMTSTTGPSPTPSITPTATTTFTPTGTPTTTLTLTASWTPTGTSTPTVTNTPGGVVLAQMVSPAPGSTFSSSTVTFNWTSGTGVSQYWLWVGTQQGDGNLYSQQQGTNLSGTVNGVPTTVPIYVRLWSRVGADWQYNDYPYGPGVVTSTPAVSPTPAGTATPTRTPTPSLSPTASPSPMPTSTVGPSLTPTSSPTATSTLTPTVTITPGAAAPAQMVSPVPGSTFASSTVTFNWTSGTGVSQYWLWVGTHAGDGDLYTQSQGTNLSTTVSWVPTEVPVYVRLWSRIAGDWQYLDYVYGPGA